MKKNKLIMIAGVVVFLSLITGFTGCKKSEAEKENLNFLVTTFPIYQITRNVTEGRKGVKVELMLPSSLGCPHDYTMTPKDMRKLEKADVLVVNGLGLEDFLGAPVKKANPEIKIIDSSSGIKNLLNYTESSEHEGCKGCGHHHHQHKVKNPHLFSSPRMSAKIAMNIMAELSKADPEGQAIYEKNAKDYAAKLNALADEMASVGKSLKNNRIVTQHGVIDYLARDVGLDIVAVIQSHGGKDPSASEMIKIIKEIKDKKAGAIFSEPQYSDRLAKTIASETGISIGELDPVATGPADAPLEYCENKMKENIKVLKKTLGKK